ncbi:MAG: hypothetical protein JXA07_01945 [Spirochaetes bacterium]|nr:hypothetical protein [Spirochaetota bacterium]
MKQTCLIVALIIAVMSGVSAQALDIGVSMTAGSGEMIWYGENPFHRESHDKDYAYMLNTGGGLVVDYRTPYKNYTHRFNLTLDYYAINAGYTQKLSRFNFDNTFCFSLLKKNYLDLWLGPQVGVHYIFGKTRYNICDAHYGNTAFVAAVPLMGYILKTWYNVAKYNMGSLHLGLVLGINIITTKNVILSLSGGLKYSAAVGGIAFRLGGLFQKNYIIYGHGFDRFVDFSILYRFDGGQSPENS